ncbi:MAG: single-stranded-DNA-specific exonuclease RecJ [Oscillibacter sp.]|nr:single-stranded-DNA-specific exonuclease RecJ [Oscillibacter sp.]
MKFRKWDIAAPNPEAVAALRKAGYPSLLASVLAARGIHTPEEARTALAEEKRLSVSPMLMKDMDKAVERVRRALRDGETVAVFGDYDVDGITSTVLLTDYLRRCGANCLRHIPRRIEDGYGLSSEAIGRLREQGASLMISVDCGITGNEEVAYANSIGLDVVVTDHHECKEALPEAVAVVDPHRPDCPYPFKHLAGVGVALKLVMALGGEEQADALFSRYCTLAAIGTIADVMRMEGENRTIVSCGLEALPRTDFPGVHALCKEVGLWDKPVTSTQIGFVLAPRINAAGRMGQVNLAVDLLECRDPARAEDLAKALCGLNRERQAVEQAIFADAERQIARLPDDQRNALVLSSNDWHQGVVGIVASRLTEKYGCPSFMIQFRDGVGKGSCRTCGGFNLFAALESCSDLLEGFGGHALAAGFTIRKENEGAFRARMNERVKETLGSEPCEASLRVDAVITAPGEATLEQVRRLDALEPYGTGNPRPVFALMGAAAEGVQGVGQGRHTKFRLARGAAHFDGIFFSVTEEECGIRPDMRVDAAFYLQPNTFRGATSLQLQLLDIRPSLCASRGEQESLDLLNRLTDGDELSAQEILRLSASREQFADCWRALQRLFRRERPRRTDAEIETDTLPCLRDLAAEIGGCEGFLRAALALSVFEERGLIRVAERGDRMTITMLPRSGKVSLNDCPYLMRLKPERE